MLRPFTCRPCLRRLQQHGPRPNCTGRVLLMSRSIANTAEAGENITFRRVHSKEPIIREPIGGHGNRHSRSRNGSGNSEQISEGQRRKDMVAAKLEATKVGKLVKYNEEWAQVWARDEIDRAREWNFLRHHLSDDQIETWKQWRRNLSQLLGYMATGDVEKRPKMPDGTDRVLKRESIESAIDEWSSWDDKKKEDVWHTLMFSALWSCPDRALVFLETTTRECTLPGYAINDVINFLARWQKQLPVEQLQSHAKSLCDLTIEVFDRSSDGRGRLRQNTIFHLTQNVDPGRIEALYHFLLERQNPIHENTLLSIADKLAGHSSYKQMALDIVIEAIRAGRADLEKTRWRSLCTSILSAKPEDIDIGDHFSAADAFGLLLEHGFTPNMVSYTAMIRNLCVSGQPERAWRVFEVMKRHNIEPDPILFSTLLDGAKRSLSASTINHVVEDAAERGAIDVVFLNDLLFSVLHFSEEEAREKKAKRGNVNSIPAFGPMLFFYMRAFKLAPLQALIPMDLSLYARLHTPRMPDDWRSAPRLFPALEAATSAIPNKLDPTGATLGVMFIAFVKSLSQPIKLISLYAYFRQLILQKNPVALQHVREKGTYIYDVILKALLESRGMQRPALDIVGDMLRDTLEERANHTSSTKDIKNEAPRIHPPPSIYTWNILLAGFLFSREKESANQISKMMQKHGVKPNVVTWNTLISGYAGIQDVRKTVQALQGLEDAGYEASTHTLKGFSRLVNKERAFVQMQKTIDFNKIKKAAVETAKRNNVSLHGEGRPVARGESDPLQQITSRQEEIGGNSERQRFRKELKAEEEEEEEEQEGQKSQRFEYLDVTPDESYVKNDVQ
ncbi:Protein Rf1, mitochondrial [Colletotrichum truncatum]|uniref:Protein Rf1, mitochondrial n=1 Tax=Colletotrichum truncatum TaxID=5467 RepID=A0ACC3ZE65_COLTU|nr:Protein Rf1, mitochondrial [Colletotrichum truncatum]KAF6794762.1 Protein Rf1, mitochondrial [Colletotrichum truncatum]